MMSAVKALVARSVSLAGAATSITKRLSRQAYFCRNKTRLMSRQNVCRDKHVFVFVATKIFCRDKHNFVPTKVLSREAYFCRDKLRQKLYLWQLSPMVGPQCVVLAHIV